MDYEKKYKEVKELIEDCIPDEDGYIHVRPSDILPELAESEDEKIRKGIIRCVKGNMPDNESRKKYIEWLEKQGKQKPDYCHHEVDLSGCSEEYCKAYYDGWNNCNQQHTQLKAEQKSAWSEEDDMVLNSILDSIQREGVLEKKRKTDWLKSLKERYTWKPSEFPYWKKSTLPDDNTAGFNSDYFCYKGYNINYKELFEKLPKDD